MARPTLNKPDMKYVDRPEVCETFCDSIGKMFFDGNTLRLELCVSRMDAPNPPNPQTGKKYPACRLVLTPQLAADMFNQLQQLMAILEKDGLVKKEQTVHQSIQ